MKWVKAMQIIMGDRHTHVKKIDANGIGIEMCIDVYMLLSS